MCCTQSAVCTQYSTMSVVVSVRYSRTVNYRTRAPRDGSFHPGAGGCHRNVRPPMRARSCGSHREARRTCCVSSSSFSPVLCRSRSFRELARRGSTEQTLLYRHRVGTLGVARDILLSSSHRALQIRYWQVSCGNSSNGERKTSNGFNSCSRSSFCCSCCFQPSCIAAQQPFSDATHG